MSDPQRGTVVKVTFEIEYPDGSRKVAELDDPGDVESLVFEPARARTGDEARFAVSEEDWKQNPSMIVYRKSEPAGIPFCTHNGCKG